MRILMGLVVAVFIMGGQAIAKTPDGETPAEEDVCVDEEGAAYGLCNAYCEAMDCDSDYPQASKTACTRVLELYKEHNNDSEPPPCVTSGSDFTKECRCFNDNDIKWISHKQYVCHTSDPRYDTSDFVFVEHGDTDDKDYVDFHVEKTETGQYWCGTYEENHMDKKYMNSTQFKDCWDIMTKYLDCPPYQPCPE